MEQNVQNVKMVQLMEINVKMNVVKVAKIKQKTENQYVKQKMEHVKVVQIYILVNIALKNVQDVVKRVVMIKDIVKNLNVLKVNMD